MENIYQISDHHLRRNGQLLASLAVLGQVVLVFAILWGIYTLYMIQKPVAGMPLLPFLRQAYVHGEFATANLHGVLKLVAWVGMLECLRRLGCSLSLPSPLGERTARALGRLGWAVMAMALVYSLTSYVTTSCWIDGSALGSRPDTHLGFTAGPLYFAVLALIGINLLQRIVRHAVELKADNEGFV